MTKNALPADLKAFTHVALMRGEGWAAADLPGHLIVMTAPQPPTLVCLHASLLVLQPFTKHAWFISREDCYETELTAVDSLALLPATWCQALGLPVVVTWMESGVADPFIVEQALAGQRSLTQGPLLLVGHCGWFEGKWCSSPLGRRLRDGSWSDFLTSGGGGGLSLPWDGGKNIGPSIGVLFSQMSPEVREPRIYASLVDAMRTRFPESKTYVLDLPGDHLDQALTLVLMRAAWPQCILICLLSEHVMPPWRRLLQHMNAESKLPNRLQGSPTVSWQQFAPVLAGIDREMLLTQIQEHSQIIPPSLVQQVQSRS